MNLFKYKVKLSSPLIDKKEAKAAYNVVLSGWLGEGEKTKEFEEKFARYIGAKYAIACVNGTAALHLVLRALDIDSRHEVIIPDVTFISAATSVLFVGAKPIFAEINSITFNIDPQDMERRITSKTKAIIVVHYGGQPADMDEIDKIAKKHNLLVIEDSAEAHGAEYKGKKTGVFGEVAIFSFTPTKNITTGEGGIITTSDEKLAYKIRILKNHGQISPYNHIEVGYNYRFTDVQAAVGIEQLKKLDKIIKEKIKKANYLSKKLNKIPYITTPQVLPDRTHTYMIYSIKLDDRIKHKRDEILRKLQEKGIQARVYFPPIHLQPVFKKLGYKTDDFPISEKISSQIISLPFGVRITAKQIDYMVKSLKLIVI